MTQSTAVDPIPSVSNVLIATDFSAASQRAFQTAIGLCIALHARLSVLHVFEYAATIPPESGRDLPEIASLYQEAEHSLDQLAKEAEGAGVVYEASIVGGLPSQTILDTITLKGIDLAVLGTNAPRGFERFIFGSIAEEVLRNAACPVLTVGPQVPYSIKPALLDGPVVFATDFHRTTTHAICYAASLCKATKSPLHCLHVLPRTLEGGFRRHVVPQIMTEALQHVATESGTTIEPAVCAVRYGSEISNTVVDYAKQEGAGLIVLGVRQASMMASHTPAHIAYRIITEAPCPVLTMAFASQPQAISTAACL